MIAGKKPGFRAKESNKRKSVLEVQRFRDVLFRTCRFHWMDQCDDIEDMGDLP